jgi:hypothetical protein
MVKATLHQITSHVYLQSPLRRCQLGGLQSAE